MPQNINLPTKQVIDFNEAIKKRGIKTDLEYWDKHKHIDLAILSARIFIEVDGIQHLTNAEQIIRDFKRDHYSDGDDFNTIRIPNELLKTHLEEIADAITEVVKQRQK